METLQPKRTPDVDKGALRQEMLAKRQALARDFVAASSAVVTQRVRDLPQWQTAREVLAYLPVRNEVDTTALAAEVLEAERRLLLPRCRDGQAGLLDIGCISSLADARPGRFGILEPRQELCLRPEAFAPDLILVPGLAFDAQGARLGFGGGYYDRLLALPMATGAYVVGLCFAFQVVARLPVEAWDRPVDAVVTERQTFRFTL